MTNEEFLIMHNIPLENLECRRESEANGYEALFGIHLHKRPANVWQNNPAILIAELYAFASEEAVLAGWLQKNFSQSRYYINVTKMYEYTKGEES